MLKNLDNNTKIAAIIAGCGLLINVICIILMLTLGGYGIYDKYNATDPPPIPSTAVCIGVDCDSY